MSEEVLLDKNSSEAFNNATREKNAKSSLLSRILKTSVGLVGIGALAAGTYAFAGKPSADLLGLQGNAAIGTGAALSGAAIYTGYKAFTNFSAKGMLSAAFFGATTYAGTIALGLSPIAGAVAGSIMAVAGAKSIRGAFGLAAAVAIAAPMVAGFSDERWDTNYFEDLSNKVTPIREMIGGISTTAETVLTRGAHGLKNVGEFGLAIAVEDDPQGKWYGEDFFKHHVLGVPLHQLP